MVETNTLLMSVGYSGTPLIKKLGILPSSKIFLVNAPSDYNDLLEINIDKQVCKKNEVADLIHLFAQNATEFVREMKALTPFIRRNNGITIWVSWYKKTSKIATDLTEDVIRNYALSNGLVDVKVCAVSDLWSGLKLVVPLSKRK